MLMQKYELTIIIFCRALQFIPPFHCISAQSLGKKLIFILNTPNMFMISLLNFFSEKGTNNLEWLENVQLILAEPRVMIIFCSYTCSGIY